MSEPSLTLDDLATANTLRQAWQQDLLAPVRIRKGYHTSQQQLADILGVTRVTLSRWESGQRSPSSRWLLRWFEALCRLALVRLGINPCSVLRPDWATDFVQSYFYSDNKPGAVDKTITLRLHSPSDILPPETERPIGVVLKNVEGKGPAVWVSCTYSPEQEAYLDGVNSEPIVDEVDYWFYLPEV